MLDAGGSPSRGPHSSVNKDVVMLYDVFFVGCNAGTRHAKPLLEEGKIA